MLLKKVEKIQYCILELLFSKSIFFQSLSTWLMAWSTGILEPLLWNNNQFDIWQLFSSCTQVHIFNYSKYIYMQHSWILHRKYFSLAFFFCFDFLTYLLAIVIRNNTKRNQFYLFYYLLFYVFMVSTVCLFNFSLHWDHQHFFLY